MAATPQSPKLHAWLEPRKRAGCLVSVDMQLFEEREGVIEGLEQILVVLDHLAAHVDAEPLLMYIVLIPIECFR